MQLCALLEFGLFLMDVSRLNLFCCVFYFNGAPLSRFMTALQVDLGFSSSIIGDILGLIRLVTSFISPTVSAYVDQKKNHRIVLMLQMGVRVIPAALMWYMYDDKSLGILSFFLLNSLISILGTGAGPISDSLLLASLPDKSRYGKVRLWGALFYGLGNLVLGSLIQFYGNFNPMFFLAFVTLLPTVAAVYYLLPPFASDVKPHTRLSVSSVYNLLTHSVSVKVFFINSVIIGAACSLVESLLFVAMERAMNGSTPLIAGASVFISVLFEIPIFHAAPSILQRFGTKSMLLVANIAWIIRALGYAVFSSAWVVLILEILHGITFGLYFSAAVDVCIKRSPPGMESTMQSLLDMTFSGIGVALGTIGGGYLFDYIGTSETFILFCLLVSISSLSVWLLFEENESTTTLSSQELLTTADSQNIEMQES